MRTGVLRFALWMPASFDIYKTRAFIVLPISSTKLDVVVDEEHNHIVLPRSRMLVLFKCANQNNRVQSWMHHIVQYSNKQKYLI